MTLTNQALSSAADKDLELSKQVCREAVNEVIDQIQLRKQNLYFRLNSFLFC